MSRPTVVIAATGLLLALTAAPASAVTQPAVAPAPARDVVTVSVPASSGRPAVTVGGTAASGGIAVNDDLLLQTATSITGQAGFADGSSISVKLQGIGLGGTITAADPAHGVTIKADVGIGVNRSTDQLVTWSGDAAVTAGGRTATRRVTFTLRDLQFDQGDHLVRFQHAGQNRFAYVHVPAAAVGKTDQAVMIHFPGLLESAYTAEYFEHLISGSDKYGYPLVLAEHYGYGWEGVPAGTLSPDVDDVGYVRQLANVVRGRFGTDVHRTYASGMSNGGFFTSLAACQLTDVFAAFAPVSGQLSDTGNCHPGRAVPIVMFHGTGDPLVPFFSVTPAVEFWAKNNGCATKPVDTKLPDKDPNDGTTVILHTYQGCEAPVELYEITNGGHVWPGGDPYPVPLGAATKDIDANDIIWNFVSQFQLP